MVAAADRLIANTGEEADELLDLYDADPARVAVVRPGVDLERLHPGTGGGGRRPAPPRPAAGRRRAAVRRPHPAAQGARRAAAGRRRAARRRPALPRAAGRRRRRRPQRDRARAPAGPAGAGRRSSGIADVVRFRPPVARTSSPTGTAPPTWSSCRRYSESFGLVALEAQACGTPVVAAAVGGLPTAVRDGVTGLLVDGHDPRDWAGVLAGLLDDPLRRRRMGAAAAAGRAVRLGRHRRRAARGLRRRHRRPPAAARSPPGARVCRCPPGTWPWRRERRAGRDRPALAGGLGSWSTSGRPPRRVRRPAARRAKLRTTVCLLVGDHSLSGPRSSSGSPDENHEAFYRWLLQRNVRLSGVAFALDPPATSTWSAGCRSRRSRRTASTGCSARCWTRRPIVQRAAGARLPASIRREWAGGSRAASRPATWRRSAPARATER